VPTSDETVSEFRAFTDELLTIANAYFDGGIACAGDDDLGEIAVLFTAKQAEHLVTIHALLDANRIMDATTIARTMLEGLALLLWTAREPATRARAWRAYSLVSDLATLRERQRVGEVFDASVETELKTRLAAEAVIFLKHGCDPMQVGSYRTKWHLGADGKPLRIIEILRDVSDSRFVGLYNDLSNWVHWNAKGIWTGLRRHAGRVHISWSDNSASAKALAASFQALLQSLELLDAHLELGESDRLNEISARYVTRMSAPSSR
jgi:hypothetical protein